MKKTWKKWLSLALIAAMVFSQTQFSSLASAFNFGGTSDEAEIVVTEEPEAESEGSEEYTTDDLTETGDADEAAETESEAVTEPDSETEAEPESEGEEETETETEAESEAETETVDETEEEPDESAEAVQPVKAVPEETETQAESAGIETTPAEKTYTAEDGGVKVTAVVPAGAVPEDAELSVTLFADDSKEYEEAAEAINLEEGREMAALDISFMVDGEEVEPTEAVKVSIDVSAILPDDADTSTLEVQHLVETPDDEIEAVVVANESSATEGTIDEENAVAVFSVESFSSFTITWAGNAAGDNTTEVTVYVYDINGLGIYDEDEQGTYEWVSGTHTISNLIEEHVSGKIGDGYTYAYSTVQYLTTSDRGGEVTTIGSADDPVISVTWNGTNYTVTTRSGATTTVASANADEFYINLYFSTPMASISVTGADTTNHTVSLIADTEYFQDSDIAYTWEITSGSEYASITGNGANVTVTWNEGDEAGTDITVKVTATSASGETATATYDLEYGMQQVTYTVYYDNGRTLAAGAHVAIYDENGNLVSNGEADENGEVTLWIVPGTTYTFEASYTSSSGTGMGATYTHYSYENTSYVYVGDGTDNTTINLEISDANFYEHVDVKFSVADEGSEAYSEILAKLDYVYIYDEEGVLIYQSSQLVHNSETNDYNVLFADADGNEGSNPHSIVFYDSYTIEIAYEISYTYTEINSETGEEEEHEQTVTYVATLDKNSTYVDGEYYSYDGTNAFQLYNAIYGTSYTESTFSAAVAAGEDEGGLEYYNDYGIDISGQTYFMVAAALCDSAGSTSQAGLDLALGVGSLLRYSSGNWNFDVQKTLLNSGAGAEEFTFSLYEAEVSSADDNDQNQTTWLISNETALDILTNNAMTMSNDSLSSVDIMNSSTIIYNLDSSLVGETQTYYYILLENEGESEYITYDSTVYGIKIEVTLNSSTDMTDVTIKETVYNLTKVETDNDEEGEYAGETSENSSLTFIQGDELTNLESPNNVTTFTFENIYKASGSVNLGVTKSINGRNSTAKSFTFALYGADEYFNYNDNTLIDTENTMGTLTENTAQSVVFDTSEIEYTEGGIYYYVIKETTNSGNGWTCDRTEYHITVITANDGSGDIIPTAVTYTAVDSEGNDLSGTLSDDDNGVYGISGDSTLSFVNTYSDAEADVIFGGTKNITGTDSTNTIFAFGLYETGSDFVVSDDSEVHATTVIGSGDFAFEEIDYTTAGTYYYVAKETTVNGSGWTIDGTEYHITVVVTDATSDEGIGAFTITVSCTDVEGNTVELTTQAQNEETGIYTITGLYFTNTYNASGSLNLAATKEYTGATLTANQFNFTVTETTEEVEEKNLYTGTGTNDADGNITITPTIEYGLSDVGTHTYEIAETAGNAGGVTYDSNKITVMVEVADAGDGTLTTTVTVNDSEIEATDGSYNVGTFSNAYEATGGVTLTATKTYTGATMTAGQFEFQISETSGRYIGTGTNDDEGNITFTPEITYTLDDAGTHTYRIVEVNGYAGGVTYDDSEIIVTVVVADNGDGTLSTTVTVNGEELTAGDDGAYNVGTLKNSYKATGSVTFGGEKKISGKDEETNQQFTFELYTTDSDFTVEGDAEATDTQTVTGAGSFTFETISYDSDVEGNGAGTYYYVVKETATGTNGWTSDTKEYRITVVVADAGNGTFALTVTCVDAEGQTVALTGTDANGVYNFTGLDFTNKYEPAPTSVQFTGSKYITNSAGDSNSADKVFTFELYNADSSFATDGDAIQTKTTTGAGTITFDKITYEETGTYYYVIQEKAMDEAEGWTIDPTVYNITVEVNDNGLGQLVATVTEVTKGTVIGSEDVYGGFDFTNAYAAEGTVTLGVEKSISGVASTDKTFSFTLYNSDGSFATGDLIETITTDGTITNSTLLNFTAIPYTKVGTYYYVIKETGEAPSGWTLDTKEYHVTVTAIDNGNGTLTTSASYAYIDEGGETQTENSAAFTNTYAATGSLSLTGTKTFTGGELTENGFMFTMTDSTGESVGDVTMDIDGNITFPTLKYDETDIGKDYTYTIKEVDGHNSSVQYDDTTYTVVVSVIDNEDGTLDVTYKVIVNGTESAAITFNNYKKGSLTISKIFTGLTEDQIKELTDFAITVTNGNGDTVATLTLAKADEGSSYTWTVSDLPADIYTVTETGYGMNHYEVIATSGEVEVTDGSDVSVDDTLAWGGEDTVAFTNDYTEVGSIVVSKYVVAEEDIQEEHKDTEYTVVITASEDADLQWVTVTSSTNREITPTIDGNTVTFTIRENETITIDGLPVAEYTVEETGSNAVTTESVVPVYRIGDHEYEKAPVVDLESGRDSDLSIAVVIENEYPIGTYIMVQKDYNKDTYPEEGFTFTIEALSCDLEAEDVTIDAKDMPKPDSTTVTITESGEIGYFGNIEYEHLGTYYYKITETAGSEKNVDYDTSVHYIKVVVAATEGTYVEITDEYEAKADAEIDDYKNLTYTEAGIVTAEFTNTAYEGLSLKKEVSGNAGDTSEYEFEITLTNSDGTPFEGTVTVDSVNTTANKIAQFFSGIVKTFTDGETLNFEDGKAEITVTAGEKVTIMVPSGVTCTVTELGSDADSVNVSVNGVYQAQSSTTEATADVGTIAESTQVIFVNSYRAYFPIDEEIVTDTDDIFDRDAWVKNEAVNEYNAIEIEMTTNLPVITAYDLENGEFTMNFHEVLDHELVLDEDTADFTVYIAEQAISSAYYRITFDEDTGDDCNFHVDVDLTALYNDGIVTEDMLDGNTEITIFFFADLEGTGLNGSYKSTIWYDIYDSDEWLYTSEESVVEVYTYEIEIQKYDDSTLIGTDYAGSALAGATLGVYYDVNCTQPVSRNGEDYTTVSGADGMAIFYGLADGTYYVKEIAAPDGYVLSSEVLTVVLGSDLAGYAYEGTFANTPVTPDENKDDSKDSGGSGKPNGPGSSEESGTPATVDSSPQTGDTSHVGLWTGLTAVSVIAIVGSVAVGIRRKRESD